MFLSFLSVTSLLISSFLINRALKHSEFVESTLSYYIILSSHIILIAYCLSYANVLSSLIFWSILSLIALLVTGGLSFKYANNSCFERISTHNQISLKSAYADSPNYYKLLLLPLLLSVIATTCINVIYVFFSAPNNFDSMCYHVARMAYYIQHGNLSYFNANYWAQVVHPKNATILMLYAFLMSGRNGNLTQLVSFISYLVAMFSVYGISRRIGNKVYASLFASLVFALLIECLLEAVTAQNDMLMTAYISCIVYFLFSFKETENNKHLVFAGISIGLVIGVKASVLLVFPSLFVIVCYTCKINKIKILLLASLMAFIMLSLPAGYFENYKIFGHPIGPQSIIKEHSFSGKPFQEIMVNGTKNLIRYGFEFASFDGLPNDSFVSDIQWIIKSIPAKTLNYLGVNLEELNDVRVPFSYTKSIRSHEDYSYWGVLGFALLWPVIFLSITGKIKSPAGKILSAASIIFLIVQAYEGPYDPWRGRYFIISAIFAAPVAGCFAQNFHGTGKKMRIYLFAVVLIACLSGLNCVIFRENKNLLGKNSIFRQNRLEQLTGDEYGRYKFYGILKKYEELVPQNATVAVCVSGFYEYPLFGNKLRRKIIPINSFWKGILPIPDNADYLLYSDNLLDYKATDIDLGKNTYLRKLTRK